MVFFTFTELLGTGAAVQNVELLLLPHDEHHHLYNFSQTAIKASAQQAVAEHSTLLLKICQALPPST